MKSIATAALTLLLAGCASRMPERYEVPIEVPCRVELPPEPAWALDALGADAAPFDKLKALLAERLQRIGYEVALKAAAQACT